MGVETDWYGRLWQAERRWLRNAAPFLFAALVAGAVLLLLESDLRVRVVSDAALDDLLQARAHLQESYGPQEERLNSGKTARRELEAARQLVAAAEAADPTMGQEAETLRADLHAVEAQGLGAPPKTMAEVDSDYARVRAELDGLIEARLDDGQ